MEINSVHLAIIVVNSLTNYNNDAKTVGGMEPCSKTSGSVLLISSSLQINMKYKLLQYLYCQDV